LILGSESFNVFRTMLCVKYLIPLLEQQKHNPLLVLWSFCVISDNTYTSFHILYASGG